MADRVGQQLGNYRLLRLLGHGGFAEVYLGEHLHLQSQAALKVLRRELQDDDVRRFLSEARTLVHLRHPSIVRVLDFTVEQGIPVLIMDYAPGGTIRQRYPHGSRLLLDTVVAFVQQIASVLQYAHNHGVIHRDVKPENLLLDADGGLLLSDFGLALFSPSPDLLSTQELVGTLPYTAPEQLRGKPGFASDQYALGIIAYEWLCGRRPFEGTQFQLIQQHVLAPPPPLRVQGPALPAAVEEVVLQALAKDPRERFVDVQAFARALERASRAGGLGSSSQSLSPSKSGQASFSTPTPVRSLPDSSRPVEAFLVASSADDAFAERLKADLEARGISVWLGRVPGTPPNPAEGQGAARQAMRLAPAVLVVVSAATPSSGTVREWLRLASLYDRPLVFVWVAGEELATVLPEAWVEQMSVVDLIDARGDRYRLALDELVSCLGRTNQAEGLVSIAEPNETLLYESLRDGSATLVRAERKAPPGRPQLQQGPFPLWNIPYRRNPFFTGREDVLRRMHALLHASSAAALTQPQAITGLGGIGKTEVAVEYAYRFRDEYQAVLWARASSRDTLTSDFLALAALLGVPEAQDHAVTVVAVERWLEVHSGWLLLLDNADDLTIVRDFLPVGGKGHIVLTTRAQATGAVASSIEVEKMAAEEGALLLLRRARVLAPQAALDAASAADNALARSIVETLDGLPLALDQAGAYIEETACGLSGYASLYQRRRGQLLRERGELISGHPESVVATWTLSFEKVEQISFAAADLLRFFAFLSPDAIPEEMITEGAGELGPHLQAVSSDPFALDAGLRELLKYSLVRRDLPSKTLMVHRLVQAVLTDSMGERRRREWAERTVLAVNKAFPDVEFSTWQRCERCLSHALMCAELIAQQQFAFLEAVRLLAQTGLYLQERAHYAQAARLFQHALAMQEQLLGPEHPDVATSLNRLAFIDYLQGRYVLAESLFLRALSIQRKVLGPRHPDVATTLNNLGVLFRAQGKYGQDLQFHRQALEIREATLGPDHPEVAFSLNNIGTGYRAQGKYAEAKSLLRRALAIQEKALGSDHPDLAFSLNNLARVSQSEHRYEEAEAFSQRALAIQEKTLGTDHYQTAFSLTSLASIYAAQRKYEEAESFYRRALIIREKTMGPEHPMVVYILNTLAWLYQAQGRLAQAEPLFERVLAIREKTLAPGNPHLARTLKSLARFYRSQGRYAQAEDMYRRLLAIREATLGAEHPYVAASLTTLAAFYRSQGRYDQAEPLYQRALAIYEQAPASRRYDIGSVLEGYAALLRETKREEAAAELERRLRAIRQRPAPGGQKKSVSAHEDG